MKVEEIVRINTPLTGLGIEDVVEAMREDHFPINTSQKVIRYIIIGDEGNVKISMEEETPNTTRIKLTYNGDSGEGMELIEHAEEIIENAYGRKLEYLGEEVVEKSYGHSED
jgi:hypothetical protein